LKEKSNGKPEIISAETSLGKPYFTQLVFQETNKKEYMRSMTSIEYSTLATKHTPVGVFISKFDVQINEDTDNSMEQLSQDLNISLTQ
jgi:hypothetical protein